MQRQITVYPRPLIKIGDKMIEVRHWKQLNLGTSERRDLVERLAQSGLFDFSLGLSSVKFCLETKCWIVSNIVFRLSDLDVYVPFVPEIERFISWDMEALLA